MRIESIGINMQNFNMQVDSGVIDDTESFSEMMDKISDEMSTTDTTAERTNPMDYYLSETQKSLGLTKRDMFPVVFVVEESSYLRSENHGNNNQNLMNKAINAYNNSIGIYE